MELQRYRHSDKNGISARSLTVLQDSSRAKVHAAQVLHGTAGALTGVLVLQQEILRLHVPVQNSPAQGTTGLGPLAKDLQPCASVQYLPSPARLVPLTGLHTSKGDTRDRDRAHSEWQWRMTSRMARALTAASRSDRWPRSTIRSNSSPPAPRALKHQHWFKPRSIRLLARQLQTHSQ